MDLQYSHRIRTYSTEISDTDDIIGKFDTSTIKYSDNDNIRKVSKWVDDDSVTNCFNCKTLFTILIRKHHCRLCGRVYCAKCSNYFTKLPLDILNKLPNKPYSIWTENLNDLVRVCGNCFAHSNKLSRIRKIVKLFEMCNFDIKDLNMLSKICSEWEDASKFILLKFREIQYKLSIEELTSKEKEMLWINRRYLIGHSRWIIQLIKSIDKNVDTNICLIDKLISNKKKNSCDDMLCTRFCTETIGLTDILDLVLYNCNYEIISKYIISCLKDLDTEVLKNYLPFFIYNMKNNSFMLDLLIDKGINNFDFMTRMFWTIKVFSIEYMKKEYLQILQETIKEKSNVEFVERFNLMLEMEQFNTKKTNIVLPICCDNDFVGIDEKNIKIMSSYSAPKIIPFIKKDGSTKLIMFKKDDIRKDHIVLNIISIIFDILKKEEPELDIEIVRYEVMPTSRTSGYIEIVEDATTIFDIMEKLGISIQNYILNNNKNLVIGVFRKRFINSTALYCVVSYLLGIGDRHLDNIMISKDGLLFHIDFGFILGQDPKYSNNRLIRVTPEIVNVIGGYGTEDYEYFKHTCVKIYKKLRLHVNLFANLLSIVPSIDPTISIDTIKKELNERFEIGENCFEAATHMDNKVETKNNFEYAMIDFLYKTKQSSWYKNVSSVTSSIIGFFKS